ncbi:DUF6879 family protein [Saccharomonospora iraqiensis]|uniref:DUF6879 family protein n=1 Tax=Saccharomonospora iraqiensis TaxID=52698 RepID=UPI00047AFD6B|nr:DUF6879 family protein [Saccharomonospora iraqiensis]
MTTAEDTRPGVNALRRELAHFRYSLFRLETFQRYSGSSEDEAFAEWRRTGSLPRTDELRAWCEWIDQRIREGCRAQRVHVVREPLTDYLRFELASYKPNVLAGEEVRIIPVSEGCWPTDVPAESDFWLVDGRSLWSMRYGHGGEWLGAQHVADPRQVVEACTVRDAALAQSVLWQDYHPR